MKKTVIALAAAFLCLLTLNGCAPGGSVPAGTPALSPGPALTPDPAPSAQMTQTPAPVPSAQMTQAPAPVPSAQPAQTPDPVPSAQPTQTPGPESVPAGIPFEDGQLYAVAYLGYQQMDGLDHYLERYLDEVRPPIHYVSDGDYYLVIPRYEGMSLSLFVHDIETSAARLFYEDPDCGPFILQCNASDVFADVTVRLTWDGVTAEFSPFLSLKDGTLDIGAYGLDLTAGPEGT